MATDNQNVDSPSGSITKTPRQSGGRWQNLIAVGAMTALLGGGLGWIGHGVGIKNENLPTTGSQYREIATDCLNVGLVLETSPGGFRSGSGVQVITCLSTRDGSIRVDSGALLVGKSNGARVFSVSGSTLEMLGTMSGSKLVITPTSGTAAVVPVQGQTGDGVHYCLPDTDGAGYSLIEANNGTLSTKIAGAGQCP